jgi:hypothetical protein
MRDQLCCISDHLFKPTKTCVMRKLLIFWLVVNVFASCNNNRGWSAADRKKMIADCIKAAAGTTIGDKAKSYCECMQPILEAKYPTVGEANKLTSADMETPEMLKEVKKCLYGENANDDDKSNDNNTADNNKEKKGWTGEQKDLFIRDCSSQYRQGGTATEEQANYYCSCMSDKIEAKMSYDEANKLTSQELQSPEWQKTILECLPKKE